MTAEALQLILDLQKKVDMYERAFLDLLFVLKQGKPNIPKQDNEIVGFVFEEIIKLKNN